MTNLQKHMIDFMASLLSTTLVYITLFGHKYTSLLEKLLSYPTSVKA